MDIKKGDRVRVIHGDDAGAEGEVQRVVLAKWGKGRRAGVRMPQGDRVVYVTVFADPVKEMDRLQELYERITEVRQELGEPQVPFHKFAGLIRDRVGAFKKRGAPEVAFRVTVHDGKVTFSARGLKGTPGS